MSPSSKFDIEKFNGSNDFTLWQVKMRAILVQQECAEALLKEDEWPTDLKPEEKAKINLKAHSSIMLSLTDEVLREVLEEKTAAGLWKLLEAKFHKNSLTNRLYLKRRLYLFKMDPNASMAENLNKFNQVMLDLQAIDVKREEEDLALILLCSLPEEFENFSEIMLYGKETLLLNDVKDALLSKELKKKVSVSSSGESSDSGLIVSRGRSNEKGNGSSRKKSRSKSRGKFHCYYCKEEGHIRRNCPQRQKGEKKESSGKANAVVAQDSSDEGESGDVLTVSTTGSTNTWVLDTGASYHMTFSKELFTVFKQWNGSVKLGDDMELDVKGSGSVQIRMFDGMVRTFDAWYVPALRKNLISLGTLDK